MLKQNSANKYKEYTFEQFVQDEYFIHTTKTPNEESICFWNEFQEGTPPNLEQYILAKSFIESINSREEEINNDDLQETWNRIQNTNKVSVLQSKKRKRLYIAIGSVACACILVMAVFIPGLNKQNNIVHNSDITTFAQSQQRSDNTDDIQLILSDSQTILLEDKNSIIVYDSLTIQTNEHKIAKEESAPFNMLFVPKGKRSRLTLCDGTKMHVNSGTRVIYPVEFDKKSREIYVDGEIFIEVTHDSQRPFIVKTKEMNIQVFGTTFNVMSYENESNKQVVLASGSVKIVSHNNMHTVLRPAQMYENNKGVENVKQIDIEQYTSWVKGLYLFKSERLDIILTKLSRYYGVNITCDSEISSLKCSGKLDLKDDLNKVLEGLAFSLPAKVVTKDQGFHLTK